MNNNDIPVWEKYTLTIEEASKYFRIGENKLRRLAEENKDAGWLIMNGKELPADTRPIVFAYHFTEILKAQVFPFQA